MGDMDHAHCQIGAIRNWPCVDIHEGFAPPIWFRVSKIARQWEAQAIRVDQVSIPQHHVTTEEHHMSGLVGVQVCFDDDDNSQHLGKLLRPQSHLVNLRLDLLLNGGGGQGGRRPMPVIKLLTIFASWSSARVLPLIGAIQRRMIPKLRDQRQAHLADHLPGIVMTKFPIAKKVHDLEGITELLQHPLDMLLDATKRWAQFHLATVTISAPLRPSSAAPGLLLGWLVNQRLGGLCNLFG